MSSRIIRIIDKEHGTSLDLAPSDYERKYVRAVVRDMSRGHDYSCHLYMEAITDESLCISVNAFPRVTTHIAYDQLNDDSSAFAERLGRLHFHAMPRILLCLEEEIRSWLPIRGERLTPAGLAFGVPSRQVGSRWLDEQWRGAQSPYFNVKRDVEGALVGSSLPARLEQLLARMDYERAKVTLTYDF